jgi:hypothetical protein
VLALGACSAQTDSNGALTGVAPSGGETGFTSLSALRVAALTTPRFVPGAVQPDRRKSWMTADAKAKSGPLLYVGDWRTEDVDVFSGWPQKPTQVGTLTGFSLPYGMCVDTKGDVFVANFGTYTTFEYARGGTSPINTYTTSDYPIGCSVSAKGDVAITDYEGDNTGGEVCIFPHGKSGGRCVENNNTACYYLWPFGYDPNGNLIGEGEYSTIHVCEIPAGGSQMIALKHKGVKILFAGSTSWDGKYIALGDQEAGGYQETGIWDVTLSGTALTPVAKEYEFTDDCYESQADVVVPFFTAKQNITPATKAQATGMLGADDACYDNTGTPKVAQWAYPPGGLPGYGMTSGFREPLAAALSLPK